MSVTLNTTNGIFARSHRRNEFTNMHCQTVTRKIVTSMIAAAVMVQSFVVAEQTSCMFSAPQGCETPQDDCWATGDSECRCSEKARNDQTCCCSQGAASESCCSTVSCCHQEPAGDCCQCGCNEQQPEPAMPADSTPQTVNWELFLSNLRCANGIVPPQQRPGTQISCLSTDQQPQSCSMQTLFCIWLT
jgi:hypothetical protein